MTSSEKSEFDTKTITPEMKVDLKKSIILPETSMRNTQIDLRSESLLGKKTKNYDLVDDELKVVTLDNDIVVKLIANNKGIFVDFRKYYKGYPTKKGIRILATKFQSVADLLDEDIKKNTK